MVNNGNTSASSHCLDGPNEPDQLRQLASQSQLICKQSKGFSLAGGRRGAGGGVEQQIESQYWTYPRVFALCQCTWRDELIQPTSESIRVDLEKFKTGQTWMGRQRGRSRAPNRAPIMDAPHHPYTEVMYSASQINWAHQRVNWSWSAKNQRGSAL